MKNSINLRVTRSGDSSASEYTILSGDCEQARLLALPANFLSLASHTPEMTREGALALGRLIASKSALGNAADLRADFLVLQKAGTGRARAAWPDLPEVATTPVELRGRLGCCGAATDGDTAILFLSHDTALPLVNIRFSRAEPAAPLVVAVARMVIDYSDGFRRARSD